MKPPASQKYPVSQEMYDRLQNTFCYHAPKPDQLPRYEELRAEARDMATLMVMLCPPSRELSLALTHLEEAVMQANAAIARNEAG